MNVTTASNHTLLLITLFLDCVNADLKNKQEEHKNVSCPVNNFFRHSWQKIVRIKYLMLCYAIVKCFEQFAFSHKIDALANKS